MTEATTDKSERFVVLLGKVGHGKSHLVNKLCGETLSSNMGASSCTREINIGTSLTYGIRILDTPGFYSSEDVADHAQVQKEALEREALSGVFLVVKIGRADEMAQTLNQLMDFCGEADQVVNIIVTFADTIDDNNYEEAKTKDRLAQLLEIESKRITFVGKETPAVEIEDFMYENLFTPKWIQVSNTQVAALATHSVGAVRYENDIKSTLAIVHIAEKFCHDTMKSEVSQNAAILIEIKRILIDSVRQETRRKVEQHCSVIRAKADDELATLEEVQVLRSRLTREVLERLNAFEQACPAFRETSNSNSRGKHKGNHHMSSVSSSRKRVKTKARTSTGGAKSPMKASRTYARADIAQALANIKASIKVSFEKETSGICVDDVEEDRRNSRLASAPAWKIQILVHGRPTTSEQIQQEILATTTSANIEEKEGTATTALAARRNSSRKEKKTYVARAKRKDISVFEKKETDDTSPHAFGKPDFQESDLKQQVEQLRQVSQNLSKENGELERKNRLSNDVILKLKARLSSMEAEISRLKSYEIEAKQREQEMEKNRLQWEEMLSAFDALQAQVSTERAKAVALESALKMTNDGFEKQKHEIEQLQMELKSHEEHKATHLQREAVVENEFDLCCVNSLYLGESIADTSQREPGYESPEVQIETHHQKLDVTKEPNRGNLGEEPAAKKKPFRFVSWWPLRKKSN